MSYTPTDHLHLWLLTHPQAPLLIGELNLVRSNQGVSLRYSTQWLRTGFQLSEDLPLIDQEFIPAEKGTAAGAVDDARPDRWGEQVIRFIDKPQRLSLLEFLYFAGDERFGALGVSTSADNYLPRKLGALPSLADADQLQEIVRKVLANEPIPQAQKRLLAPGVSFGGARPKALIDIGGAQWVIKFSAGDPADAPLVEHATMTLARKAKINAAQTQAVRLTDGHAVAIRRFDRQGGRRVHCLTAHVALRAAAESYGYPELAQLLRRRGVIDRDAYLTDMRELFRRMVFNILIDNTDDHEKNHALLMTDAQQYALAPAYDVLPSGQALGFQQMRVGEAQADSTIENALSQSRLFALDTNQAVEEVRAVAHVVDKWQEHFKSERVSRHDIELYAQQIDRPFLQDQRKAYL
ncbi:MAG TPA: HipA domain-containing protein [Steroidobacteraceae bacterium]|nr:HipA domain-containing protein [Steroidobacteraceae bacterium]